MTTEFQTVASCWEEMRNLTANGKTVCADPYLQELTEPSDSIDLIYAEYVLRTQLGESVRSTEFIERFPQFEQQLRRQFALDGALSSVDTRCDDTAFVGQVVESRLPNEFERIGKYTIIKKLSQGAQGIVYRAVHPDLQHEVVIKLAANGLEAECHKHRLIEEGRLLAGLEHPNLGRVYDLDFHDEQ